MGNEAIALGALHAGVGLVAGYPGTPSTEILETVAKNRPEGVYVEWSVNEKAAVEVAAGAAYAGVRVLVTMKQMGLNVASDPVMCLSYVGIKGGMVLVAADDPGPISSQTEQDTRRFAAYSKLPVFDPASPEEAYEMVGEAFSLSERYATPVLLRPTTRVCHGCAAVDAGEPQPPRIPEGFQKGPRWVIFPRLSYENHRKIEARALEIGEGFSQYKYNAITGEGRRGIAVGGVSTAYVKEALGGAQAKLFRVATPYPFPEKLALEFLRSVDEVLVIEELDPMIEDALTYLCGKHRLPARIRGKRTGDAPIAGENSVESVKSMLEAYLGLTYPHPALPAPPPLAVRPPVLCAGCPHRASFYAVKTAMKGRKAIFCGDIGCYTLGNAPPLDMVDTCLCMGADVTMAQGLRRADPDTVCFSFIGDSTFFASGITGVVNAVYNKTDIVLIVLDNSTTAMTGHQPHPGTGRTMMGNVVGKVSIEKVLRAVGVETVLRADPLRLAEAAEAVRKAAGTKGVSAVLFESPCIAVTTPSPACSVDPGTCVGCKKCVKELGCPALIFSEGKAAVEPSLCNGCTLCAQICPTGAISGKGDAK